MAGAACPRSAGSFGSTAPIAAPLPPGADRFCGHGLPRSLSAPAPGWRATPAASSFSTGPAMPDSLFPPRCWRSGCSWPLHLCLPGNPHVTSNGPYTLLRLSASSFFLRSPSSSTSPRVTAFIRPSIPPLADRPARASLNPRSAWLPSCSSSPSALRDASQDVTGLSQSKRSSSPLNRFFVFQWATATSATIWPRSI